MTRLEILISTKANFKYDAVFSKNNKTIKIIHFGDNRYQDYFDASRQKKKRKLHKTPRKK
jgi:hypothetical protein